MVEVFKAARDSLGSKTEQEHQHVLLPLCSHMCSDNHLDLNSDVELRMNGYSHKPRHTQKKINELLIILLTYREKGSSWACTSGTRFCGVFPVNEAKS